MGWDPRRTPQTLRGQHGQTPGGHFPNQRRVLVVSMYMAQNVQSTLCKNISIISRNLNKYHMMNVNIRRCAIFLNFLDFSKTASKWNDDTFYHKTLHPVKVCWYGIHYMQEIQKNRRHENFFFKSVSFNHFFNDDVIKWKHFRVTGHLCGEFTDLRWTPRTKTSDAELRNFLWSASE